MGRLHIPMAEPDALDLFAYGASGHCLVRNAKERTMREWQKPTIEETESGMEVTSYLPAELDRA